MLRFNRNIYFLNCKFNIFLIFFIYKKNNKKMIYEINLNNLDIK